MNTKTATVDDLASAPLGPARILLVEDSEHDRRFFRRTLEKAEEGFEIVECADAESALRKLNGESFDLLVSDLNMPGIDGLELIQKARPLLEETGVLILTGSRDVQSIARAVRLRVLDFLFKDPREALRENLLPQLRGALKQIRLVRENRRLEKELRLRLAHLEQIYQQLPDALFAVLDHENRIIEINEQAKEFLGFHEGEPLIGAPISGLLSRFSANMAETVEGYLKEGKPVSNICIEAPTSGGDDRLFLLSINSISDQAAADDRGKSWHVLSLRDVTPAKTSQSAPEDHAFHGLIGRHHAIMEVCELIRRVAPLPTSVLITGPTGSGKEVIARAIHAESDRAKRPFIAVNCTALSSEILESELFGHVRGAFTGAVAARKGRFREADGGTLFLDEIGDTSESFQTKLLRALDSGHIEPVGQDRPVEVNVRIICATNKDLEQLVEKGRFREDLFYRINVVRIRVPSLAERIGDLPMLVERFRQEFNQRFQKAIRFVSQDAIRAMGRYSWPGNVRELRHVMEHAFVVAQGPTLTLADLPPHVAGGSATPGRAGISAGGGGGAGDFPPPSSIGEQSGECEIIRSALEQTCGNIGKAAQHLKMHRTTLWRKMRQYGIGV